MKHSHILLFSFSLVCMVSCEQKKEIQENNQTTEQATDEIHSLLAYAYTDSLMQGSHKVVYSITSEADDELPTVVDEDGIKFKDNRFKLVIK